MVNLTGRNKKHFSTKFYSIAMLARYKVFTPKPTNKAELMTVLEAILEDLPREAIDQAVLAFRRRL